MFVNLELPSALGTFLFYYLESIKHHINNPTIFDMIGFLVNIIVSLIGHSFFQSDEQPVGNMGYEIPTNVMLFRIFLD